MSGSLLEALVEEELGSVVFVMDYLQLDFVNARFSAYVWPTVRIGEVSRRFGDQGYRDALCALISHEVIATEESQVAGLVIRFGLGDVVVNPEPTDLSGPEIAMLQVHADPFREASWAVWRPGEHVLADRVWPRPRHRRRFARPTRGAMTHLRGPLPAGTSVVRSGG